MPVIFISIGNSLFRSSAAARLFNFNGGFLSRSRACFSSVHQPQSGNWVDDIRKGADNFEDGRNDISGNRRKERRREVLMEEDGRANATRERDTSDSVAEMAKEGAGKAMETGIELGEKAKQTMDIAWDGFKETTRNVKDAVVGNDDDHTPVNLSDDHDNIDSHVHNLRKRSGGYDLQDK